MTDRSLEPHSPPQEAHGQSGLDERPRTDDQHHVAEVTSMRLTRTERTWACAAFGATVIGSLGPWVSLGPFSTAGTDADGVITLIAAIVGLVLVLLGRGRIAVGLVGVLILAIGIYDIGDVSSSGADIFGQKLSPSVGWGLWVVTIGGGAAVLCSLARRLGIVKPDPSPAPAA